MKINVTVRPRIPEDELKGLLVSFLDVLMEVNRTKKVGKLNHFYQERLGRRSDRAALNSVLNSVLNVLKTKEKKPKGSTPSNKIKSTSRPKTNSSQKLSEKQQSDIQKVAKAAKWNAGLASWNTERCSLALCDLEIKADKAKIDKVRRRLAQIERNGVNSTGLFPLDEWKELQNSNDLNEQKRQQEEALMQSYIAAAARIK